ncbi:hypothetical protein MTO96_013737 [Rhipicephalus appendiculatus]
MRERRVHPDREWRLRKRGALARPPPPRHDHRGRLHRRRDKRGDGPSDAPRSSPLVFQPRSASVALSVP